ncbi:YdcF family protein [Paenibacillus filicis]|uniref:YdcF family protein n=1 Tax=Paenibacillus gyeongsangnamensis TaxID=3388067 RepID=A0ABT4Q3Y5_9BACL|nr:YdcF family protein [Paenibacillus filicis]MCZ8511595.1 YdcF family protein [Paenibacillus filicis]
MTLLIYLVIGLTVLLFLFMLWIHTAPLRKEGADVMIVLGFQCDNDRIHPLLEERLLVALELYRSHPFEKIILTGGAVSSARSEAVIMKDYLVRNGVQEEQSFWIKRPWIRFKIFTTAKK